MWKSRSALLAAIGIFAVACAAVIAQTAAQQAAPTDALVPYYTNSMFNQQNWDPRLAQFQSESAQLLQQYTKASKAEEKQEVRKKINDVLGKQFDANSQQQQKELDDLEKQIANLRSLLKKRLDAKSSIVERRLEQLIQEAEGLGWTAPPASMPRNTLGGVFSGRGVSGTTVAPAANPTKTPEATR